MLNILLKLVSLLVTHPFGPGGSLGMLLAAWEEREGGPHPPALHFPFEVRRIRKKANF